MRLLKRDSDGEFRLTKDLFGDTIPPYAILSHTWGPDTEEVTFEDMIDGSGKDKAGYNKIKFCAEQAERDGLRYFWVDTCCIDRSNNSELSEAINSMFRWYRDSVRCYVYLSDISIPSHELSSKQSKLLWESTLRLSRWFTRGWTLQELLAPVSVEFFTREGRRLGDKRSLERQIHEITGIAIPALQGVPLSQFEVNERLKWAEKRQTAREEDWAYCLLGLFDIFMPLIYGEGRGNAIRRLRKEIDESVNRKTIAANAADRASFIVPFPKNRRFVGREDTLDTLQQILFIRNECQRIAIVGLGGVGKTQVALELAYWVKDHRPEYSVFWVPALSVATFEQAYAEIARKLPVQKRNDEEDIKVSVRRYLSSETAGPWLLVVDNADDMDVLFGSSSASSGIIEYLPENEGGRTLFTTRSREVAASVAESDMVELHEMDSREAKRFFSNMLIQKDHLRDEAAVMELLKELTYLPLAIRQAAAYLNVNQVSITEYLGLLRGTEKDVVGLMSRQFHDRTRYGDSQNAVATTWIVSFEQIRKSDWRAADLLSFMSYIEPKAIPMSILPALESEEQMRGAIGKLCGYAFLGRRGQGDMFDMHSLVHVATRVWIERERRLEQTETEAIHHLMTIFTSVNVANRELCRDYLPHALRVLQRSECLVRERYDLFYRVGRCLSEDRRFKEAISCFTEVCQWSKESLAEEDHFRLSSEHEIASAYLDNRQIKDAIRIFEHVVAVRRRTLEEEDSFRLASEHELARAYLEDRRIKEAIHIFEQVVAVEKRILEEDDHSRLTSEHELASAYLDDRRIKEAIHILEHVVAVEKGILAEDDYSRLTSEHELARAYLDDRRIKEAIRIFEHVVVVYNEILAEDDASRLWSEHELARAYLEDRRIKEGIHILEHVVTVKKRILAEDDHARLTSEHELARAYLDDRRIKEAIRILEHVVTVDKRVLAENDFHRLTSNCVLARAYLDDRRVKEAIHILEHVVAAEKRILAEDDHYRLSSEHFLARAYLDDGRIKEAIDIFEQVVAVEKRIMAEDDHARLWSEHELARAYREDGRIKEAIHTLEHVVAARRRILAEDDYSRLRSEHELARAYLSDRRIKEAIRIFEHVVAVQKRTLAEDDHFCLLSRECLTHALQMADQAGVC